MKSTSKTNKVLTQINSNTKLGDLRKTAKNIKRDHKLAMELWATTDFLPRMLAILIMDHKRLSQEVLDGLDWDMQSHSMEQRTQLMDWLLANQLTKSKRLIAMMRVWKNSPSVLQRRTYWYYQGRLRWTGQIPPDNTAELLSAMESKIVEEEPEVQWAMNFTAGWIGVFDKKHRTRCMELGRKTGLFKGEVVSRGCTPNYLPDFIEIEAGKRDL